MFYVFAPSAQASERFANRQNPLAPRAPSIHVQVFGRRNTGTMQARGRPASEKRQGTKSRGVGHWWCRSAMGI